MGEKAQARGWRRLLASGAAAAALATGLAACGGQDEPAGGGGGGSDGAAKQAEGKVTFLLPENVVARWEGQDAPFVKESLEKYAPGLEVETQNALNDQSKQQSQAETAIARGTKVLIVTAVDQKGAARIVTNAKQQGVPVIAYDRLISDSPVAGYVSVDGEKIGELQGKWMVDNTKRGDKIALINGSPTDDNAHLFRKGYVRVLDPLFKSRERVKVADEFTPGWEPDRAQREMEQILTRTNNDVQGVLSANDGMAAAVISALRAQGMAGDVPVTGLDGTSQALNLILRGQQGMSAYRSLREQADKAAQMVAALAAQKPVPEAITQGTTKNNGAAEVPWAQVTPQVITRENVEVVIKDGAAEKAEVCEGVKSGVGPC